MTLRILLSNDDGYFAPGLAALAQALSALGTVTVVAPERDRSGASNSLTLDRPLSVRKDVIVSGINHGANMGDDTIYSGTVAAATEGFLLGIPSIAISLAAAGNDHFATAAEVARGLVERNIKQPLREPMLLNVNVPDVPHAQLCGTEVTRLGKRHKAEPVVKALNPRGEPIFWVGAAGSAQDAGEGTDFYAVSQRRVSITPLQVDLTRVPQMDAVRRWLTS